MYIHDFFQNFLKTFLVWLHSDFTSSMIAPDMSPRKRGVAVAAEAVGVGGRSHGERGGAGSRDGGRGGDWIVNQPMEEDRGQTILHKPPKYLHKTF